MLTNSLPKLSLTVTSHIFVPWKRLWVSHEMPSQGISYGIIHGTSHASTRATSHRVSYLICHIPSRENVCNTSHGIGNLLPDNPYLVWHFVRDAPWGCQTPYESCVQWDVPTSLTIKNTAEWLMGLIQTRYYGMLHGMT